MEKKSKLATEMSHEELIDELTACYDMLGHGWERKEICEAQNGYDQARAELLRRLSGERNGSGR